MHIFLEKPHKQSFASCKQVKVTKDKAEMRDGSRSRVTRKLKAICDSGLDPQSETVSDYKRYYWNSWENFEYKIFSNSVVSVSKFLNLIIVLSLCKGPSLLTEVTC